MNNNSFLGRGWSFPPEFTKNSGSVAMTEEEENIEKSIEIILTTRPGEHVMEQDFGCNLDELLFNAIDLSIETFVVDKIKTALLYFEPRIDVNDIEIDTSNEHDGVLFINIDYTIRATNSRMNKVYPFYKKEGTEIV